MAGLYISQYQTADQHTSPLSLASNHGYLSHKSLLSSPIPSSLPPLLGNPFNSPSSPGPLWLHWLFWHCPFPLTFLLCPNLSHVSPKILLLLLPHSYNSPPSFLLHRSPSYHKHSSPTCSHYHTPSSSHKSTPPLFHNLPPFLTQSTMQLPFISLTHTAFSNAESHASISNMLRAKNMLC